MAVFQDLIEARAQLTAEADAVLAHLREGRPPPHAETERVDCKEEPGRRGRNGVLLPGESQNNAAADYLAKEVCCLANTPGGGALILGVADGTWEVLGTNLEVDWLRHRIYQQADIAPAIEERTVAGQRLLMILVAESREPVEDADGKIRWRVGTHCVPVDRAEWWQHHQRRAGLDPMAAVTDRAGTDAAPAAVALVRRYVREGGDSDLADAHSDTELLRRLGVLSPTGHLTQAGVLMFVPAQRSVLRLARFDVPGGEVIGSYDPPGELTLLEQLSEIEARLDAYNPVTPVGHGFSEASARSLPPRTVREAVLNGVAHRDWWNPEPTTVTWIDADSRLEVVSPGGFSGGITADNVLTQRFARYPALSDLLRALRLVDRQGVGVDRMYREMIVLGHRPPHISEIAGPRVRTTLSGGPPVLPVVSLMDAIRPEVRKRDVRVAVLVYELLHRPFLTRDQAAAALQTDRTEAVTALEAAEQSTVDEVPLVQEYKDVYVLSQAALARVERASDSGSSIVRKQILPYRRPDSERGVEVVKQWLAVADRITSGDYATLTGVSRASANRLLSALVGDVLERSAETKGRSAHFVLRRGR